MRSKCYRFFLVLSFISLFSLAGCLHYEIEVSLNTDGSGVIHVHYWKVISDSAGIADRQVFSILENIIANVEDSSTHYQLLSNETFFDSTESTWHANLELEFTHFDSLGFVPPFRMYDMSLKQETEGVYTLSQYLPPLAESLSTDTTEYTAEFRYEIPGRIFSHNAHEKKGNWLIWRFKNDDIGAGKELLFTYEPYPIKETPLWIYIATGFVILIVLLYLFRPKKN